MTSLTLLLASCGGSTAPSSPPSSAIPSGPSASTSAAGKPSGSAATAGLPAINVSYSQATAGFGPLYIAKEAGMFQRAGIDVTLKRVSGTAQVPSLVANEIQIAGVGGTEVTNVDMAGGSLVMLATVDDYPTFSLYANKKYKTVPDLAGESIGITTAGSSTDVTAQLFIKHYNMQGKIGRALWS
jgi:ABC-type nitrate/sulfonate/bicarbonate transport system substrate-binding protein